MREESSGEESHLSKAAFADDFEIIKIIGFDPNTEKKLLVPRTTIDNKKLVFGFNQDTYWVSSAKELRAFRYT